MALDKDDISTIRAIVIEALEAIVLPRFDEHDQRFDRLEARMDKLEANMGKLETRMGDLDHRMDSAEHTTDDLKSEMRSGFAAVNKRIDDLAAELSGRISALEADVKELYFMVAKLEKSSPSDKKFAKLGLEQKLLKLNNELLLTAKQAGITLPR